MDKDQKAKLLELYPVLREVDQALLQTALASARVVTLERGALIFNEFQPCNVFPFVLSGDLRVFKQSAGGRELTLYHVSAGDACIVSAGCLLGDGVYNAAGQVKEDVCLVMVSDQAFEALLESKAFRDFTFSLISRRLLHLMQLVEEVAFSKLDRRLAAVLVRQGPALRVSHQELAGELGTVREMVTRMLNSFSDAGLIRLGRGQIEVIDREGLKELLEN